MENLENAVICFFKKRFLADTDDWMTDKISFSNLGEQTPKEEDFCVERFGRVRPHVGARRDTRHTPRARERSVVLCSGQSLFAPVPVRLMVETLRADGHHHSGHPQKSVRILTYGFTADQSPRTTKHAVIGVNV